MSFDAFFPRDIERMLRAVASADKSAQEASFDKDASLAVGDFQVAYHVGFQAALTAVGLGFGLEPIWIEAMVREGDR